MSSVSPYIGEWIEISTCSNPQYIVFVSPYIGEWIEITGFRWLYSLHSVSPYIGEWIEINAIVVLETMLITGLTLHR